MKTELVRPIQGIIPPMITPLTEQGLLDEAGLERLVEHLFQGGVHGLFILGTTGEGPSLSAAVQEAVITRTAENVDGKLPVLVGVTHPSMEESLRLARVAADVGCDAIVVAPPYYFDISQQELVKYIEALAERSPLPVVLYNMPALTGCDVSPDVVKQLIGENTIVGIKDSSGDLENFFKLISITQEYRGFPVLVGPEQLLLETLSMGGAGGVTGGANICPRLFVGIYEAFLEGHTSEAEQLAEKAAALGKVYSVGPRSISAIVARTKTAVSLLGLCHDATAMPIEKTNPAEREKIAEILEELHVYTASADFPDSATTR